LTFDKRVGADVDATNGLVERFDKNGTMLLFGHIEFYFRLLLFAAGTTNTTTIVSSTTGFNVV
jgi:hypothetical protein